MTSPAELALATDAANFRLGNEAYGLLGATFVRNTQTPHIYDANHVADARPTTEGEIDAFLEAIEREYQASNHRRFDTDHRTPPEFAARLALEGFERYDGLIFLLEGDLIGGAPACDIRPIETEADWDGYWELHLQNWLEHQERLKRPPNEEIARSMLMSHRLKQPPVQYFMAYVMEKPVAYFNSWAGIDGVGQVEDLFTAPEHRKKGYAEALIHHCVADARAKGAGPVVIAADPTDTPKQIYARMGWRPVALHTKYTKVLNK